MAEVKEYFSKLASIIDQIGQEITQKLKNEKDNHGPH